MARFGELLGSFGALEVFQLLRDGGTAHAVGAREPDRVLEGTIAARVDELLSAGLVSPVADAVSTGGRPPARVVLNSRTRLVAAADFGATHAIVALLDLNAEVLVERRVSWDIARGPVESLDWLASTLAELLDEAERSSTELISIGIGLPGPVEHTTGRPTNPPIMPGWDGFDVPAHLRTSFDVPVLVDNDVNVMAIGEKAKGFPTTRDMVVVKVSTGIGSGIISGGELQRGAAGIAGDIGHIPIPRGDGIVCRCGNVGCLEAVAGTPAVIKALADEGLSVHTTPELLAAGRAGDLRVMRTIREAGRDIGYVLNMCVSIVNPSVIVIGGALAESNDLLVAGMREVVYGRSMPLATQDLIIAPSKAGALAGVIGAAIMAIEFALSPEQMQADAALEKGQPERSEAV